MSKFTIIGELKELNENGNLEQKSSKEIFSGKMAGICYQRDAYFGTSVSDSELAEKRFYRVAKTEHHSIAGHVNVTVLCENISKMLAMVLNSTNHYNTSEKSGRYTVMTGSSEKERDLYNKWRDIFHYKVLEAEPSYDDNMLKSKFKSIFEEVEGTNVAPPVIKDGRFVVMHGEYANYFNDKLLELKADKESMPSWKIAQENARYLLSIFTRSTTLSYTTDLAQWNYIYDWGIRFIEFNKDRNDYFFRELSKDIKELCDFIKESLYVEELREGKDRCFDFLGKLTTDDYLDFKLVEENFNFDYLIKYNVSFVSLAQLQRHRTLKYYMNFDVNSNYSYFVPDLIADDKELVDSWLSDLNSVSEFIPQATLVEVVETGTMYNFILKCKERSCGRAQYETMKNTVDTINNKFISASENGKMSKLAEKYLDKLLIQKSDDYYIKAKCELKNGCKEPCFFKNLRALDRKF